MTTHTEILQGWILREDRVIPIYNPNGSLLRNDTDTNYLGLNSNEDISWEPKITDATVFPDEESLMEFDYGQRYDGTKYTRVAVTMKREVIYHD